jgi:hypothetical protein
MTRLDPAATKPGEPTASAALRLVTSPQRINNLGLHRPDYSAFFGATQQKSRAFFRDRDPRAWLPRSVPQAMPVDVPEESHKTCIYNNLRHFSTHVVAGLRHGPPVARLLAAPSQRRLHCEATLEEHRLGEPRQAGSRARDVRGQTGHRMLIPGCLAPASW